MGKISALPAVGAVADANEFEVNEAGTSKKATMAQIRARLQAAGLVMDAGTTGLSPFVLTSGTNMTTPGAGAHEYNGKAFYKTPNASNRGVDLVSHLTTCDADFTGTNVTTAQPMFPAAQDTITLPANVAYLLEIDAHVHTTGATSHTFGILFGGTATLTNIAYWADVTNAATEVLGASQRIWAAVGTIIILTAATATATHHSLMVRGIVRIANAGTFIPQYQWGTNAPGTAGVTLRNSYCRLTPIGVDTTAFVGNWA